jgi:hypothetical protein
MYSIRIAAGIVIGAFIGSLLFFGTAASAPAEPAKSYGLCVSKSTGYTRALERTNLGKSSVGKCKSTETKITIPSVTWPGPSKLVFVHTAPAGTTTDTCTRSAATPSTLTFACTTVVTPPSPAAS